MQTFDALSWQAFDFVATPTKIDRPDSRMSQRCVRAAAAERACHEVINKTIALS